MAAGIVYIKQHIQGALRSIAYWSDDGTPTGNLSPVAHSDALSLADRELVVTTYVVSTAFTGASVGDTITSTQIIDVSGAPSTVSTVWRNQTTAADLSVAPSAANLALVGATALTNAQLRASAIAVSSASDTALGAPADAAWSGTGSGGVVALLKALWAALTGTLTTKHVAASYTDISVASLSSGQAAGTATVIAADATRRVLMINPPADCFLALGSGATTGYPLYAGVPNSIVGQECPTNALYVVSLTAATALTVWSA